MAERSENEDRPVDGVVTDRTMNIVVSLLLMTVAAIVMIACYRLGAGWAKDVGPDSGYFPFYVALIMFFCSGVTLVQHLLDRKRGGDRIFIARSELMMVLQVLIPTIIFVVLSIYIGIYISMALFIGFFMMWHGHYPAIKAVPVAIAIPVVLFVVFEIWFLVPLPKGPFEAWLGY
ncbi:MAG: tripartite tricarboxylate transporter TctB family protein [Burkholderiales bacterium]